MGGAIIPSTLATGPAPPITTLLLGSIPTVLTHPQIATAQPTDLLRLLPFIALVFPHAQRVFLGEAGLNFASPPEVRSAVGLAVVVGVGVPAIVDHIVRRRGEQREDADADAQGGRRRQVEVGVVGVVIGDGGRLLGLLVVQGRRRADEDHVAEAEHVDVVGRRVVEVVSGGHARRKLACERKRESSGRGRAEVGEGSMRIFRGMYVCGK